MIHLGTNLLIGAGDSADEHHLTARRVLTGPGPFACSSVAWTEFHSQPLPLVLNAATRGLLTGGIFPFDEATAVLAGELYHLTGSNAAPAWIP